MKIELSGADDYLNLHAGDVAHTLLLGATGAGNSFTLGSIIQSMQQYAPLTFIFDVGGSYEGGSRLLSRFSHVHSRFQLRAGVSPPWLTGVSASKFRGTVQLQCICKKSPILRHFTSHGLSLNPSSPPTIFRQQSD